MKNSLIIRSLSGTAVVIVFFACMAACSQDGEFRPALAVVSADGADLAGGSLNYDERGGAATVRIESNGGWEIACDADWVKLSERSGTGDGELVVSAGESAESRSAAVAVTMTSAPQVYVSFGVAQHVTPPPAVYDGIYRDGFDGAAALPVYGATGDAWPSVAEFPDFAAPEGRGADDVAYSGDGASVCGDGESAPEACEGASGGNNVRIAGGGRFRISGVAPDVGDADLELSFGVLAESDVLSTLEVRASGDGERWSRLEYDVTRSDNAGGWCRAVAGFTLAEVPERLDFVFDNMGDGEVCIDDATLDTGTGGVGIDLSDGGPLDGGAEEELPKEREITVAELNALMPEFDGASAADDEYDLLLEAVVMNDAEGGNFPDAALVLASANASEAGCGVILSGGCVDPAALGLTAGDMVRVRLKAGEAMLRNDRGELSVTGAAGSAWAEVERTGSDAEVRPVAIDVARMAEYQGMAVMLRDAVPTTGGVWCTQADGVHEFYVAGIAVRVFVRGGAAAFAGEEFEVRKGDIAGIATVCDGRVCLWPRNTADVAAFGKREAVPAVGITIPEIAAVAERGAVRPIDPERDRVLDAVVMSDADNGNIVAGQLVIAMEGAVEAGNGLTLYGRRVALSASGLRRGDRVRVTLKANAAMVTDYGGMMEVTGDESAEWIGMEVTGRAEADEPVKIGIGSLAEYQGMAVRIEGVRPSAGGRWYDAAQGGYVVFHDAAGVALRVRVMPEASFADTEFSAREGDICGLAAVTGGMAVLYPRDAVDVSDFAVSDEDDDPAVEEPSTGPDDEGGSSSGDDDGDGADDPDGGSGGGSSDDDGSGGGSEDGPDSEPAPDPTPDPTPDPAPEVGNKYVEVSSSAGLSAGTYLIGGYRDGRLYLATGGLTSVNHCNTAEFVFGADGSPEPADGGTAEAAEAVLEAADEAGGYYIRFGGEYLSASGAGAGKLRLSTEKGEYWIFSDCTGGGFELRQSGPIPVKLIISKTATSALLRSIAASEEGYPVMLFRRNAAFTAGVR